LICVYSLLLAAALSPEPIATYKDGVVSREDVDSWNRYLDSEGRPHQPKLADQAQQIVLLRSLERRYQESSPAVRARSDSYLRFWQLDLGKHRLEALLRTEAAPSDAETRGIFDADPSAYAQPQLWVLQNIFKRLPEEPASPDAKAQVRLAMDALRRRAILGEDFAELARQESESETRLRGGSLGAVSPDRLTSEAASVVSSLKAGDISRVFESSGGLTLLRCEKILDAKPPKLDDARPRIVRPIGEARFQQALQDLSERLLAVLAPEYRSAAMSEGGDTDVVVSFRDEHGARRQLHRMDVELFLTHRGFEPAKLSSHALEELLHERMLLEGFSREAAARGLLGQEHDPELLGWKTLEFHARGVESALDVPEPSEDAVREAYAKRQARLVAPARSRLEALKLLIRPDQPRSLYENAQRLGEQLVMGSTSFAQASASLDQAAERLDLGWMNDDEVWMMGLNVDTAVKATPAGGSTRLVQEGKTLYLVHVLAKEPERQLSLEESRGDIVRGLKAEARGRVADASERELIAAESVVLTQ
jgi:parvulin-like peptidyl-prolyl isomerase